MFGIEPTPIDLQFHLGRIPVRVHPGFWIVGALGGWHPEDLRITVIWMLCLFASILVHELGHALTSEAFGWPSEILLYHFGGLAFSQRYHGNTPMKSILVSLAGPFAGFAFALVVGLVNIGLLTAGVRWDEDRLMEETFWMLYFINVGWGVVNLAPVMPLDGGQILRSVLEWSRVRNYDYVAAQVGLIVGGLMAAGFLTLGGPFQFPGMLFLFLSLQNFMTMQQVRRW